LAAWILGARRRSLAKALKKGGGGMAQLACASLGEQVAFIQETESLLFHRWRRLWEKAQSGRRRNPLRQLTSSQFHTVMVIYHEREVTISRLARIQGVSKASASVMVERLVVRGALVREPDCADRRRVVIRVSPEYLVYLGEALESKRRHRMELAERIGPDAVSKWYEALKRVREVFEAEERAQSPEERVFTLS